jgi:hypothetical protein
MEVRERGKSHRHEARVPMTCATALCNPGDVDLLEACGGDDRVQGDEASVWVVAAAAIGSRWCARVPPEAAVAATLEFAIWQPRGGILCAVWWRKERGGGVYIGVEDLGKWLGVWVMSVQSDGVGELRDRADLCETKTMADRWAMPISGRERRRGYHFGADGKWAVGQNLAWADFVPVAFSSLFLKHFSFLVFETVGFLLATKIA